jgi:DNA mismatch repair protein MSH2
VASQASVETAVVRRLLDLIADVIRAEYQEEGSVEGDRPPPETQLEYNSCYFDRQHAPKPVELERLPSLLQQCCGARQNPFLQCSTDPSFSQYRTLLLTGLAFHLHSVHGGGPLSLSSDTVLSEGHGSSALAMDSAAATALHLWPPSNNIGHQQFVGGNATNQSVFSIFSHACVTSLGPPRLEYWLQQPLTNRNAILQRQDAVDFWVRHSLARDALRTQGLRALTGLDLHHIAHSLSHYSSLVKGSATAEDGGEVEPLASTNASSSGGWNTRKALVAMYHLYLLSAHKVPLLTELFQSALTEDSPNQEINNQDDSLLTQLFQSLLQCNHELQRSVDLVDTVMDLQQAPREYVIRADYKEELVDIQEELERVTQEIQAHHEEINEAWSQVSGTPAGSNAVRLESVAEGSDNGGSWQFRLTDTNHSKILQTTWKGKVTVHKILKNGVYFTTQPLRQWSQQQADLRREQDQHQRQVVQDAIQVAATYAPVLLRLAEALAPLDVLVALAHVAAHSTTGPYCRPELTDSDADGAGIHLIQARHPCVERQESIDFIPNDYHLVFGESNFLIVTGPNSTSDGLLVSMCVLLCHRFNSLLSHPFLRTVGGKSTYIRALGAIVTMAQIGAFVPCTSATINICQYVDFCWRVTSPLSNHPFTHSVSLCTVSLFVRSHILTRVGAGDHQDRGISTFMAEMLESSSILRTATKRSLIIIDELGRGTSTFDGYGLAKAIAEYIVQSIGCITVFATHFHELTVLEEEETSVRNCHVTAQKGDHGLTFLYEIQPGPCLESFGIQVAEMAQVPQRVVQDAKRRAQRLEHWDRGSTRRRRIDTTDQQRADTNEANQDATAWLQRFCQLPIPDLLSKQYTSEEEKRLAVMNLLELEAA